jgi:hypothetical protein
MVNHLHIAHFCTPTSLAGYKEGRAAHNLRAACGNKRGYY